MNKYSQSWFFNECCVSKLLNDFKIENDNKEIKIYLDDDNIITTTHIDKTLFFQSPVFKDFIINTQNYNIKPLFANIKVKDEYYEMGIIGETININGELYFKYILISDSIDNKLALQTNIGLLHQNTNNIIVSTYNDNVVTNKWRFRTDNFNDSFNNIDNTIEKYAETLKKLYELKTSYKKFVEKIVEYDENKKIKVNIRHILYKLNKIVKAKYIQDENLKLALKSPETFLASNLDFTINSNLLFQYYIGLFQDQNIVTIIRESNRSLEMIFKILEESFIKNKYEHLFEVKTGINFQRFYANQFNKLSWFLSKYTNDLDKAQDFANEAFIQGLEKIDTYNPEKAKIHTWIYRIGENIVRKNYKDEQRMATVSFDKTNKDDLNLLNIFSDKTDNTEELRNSMYVKKAEILKEVIYNLPDKYEKYKTVLIMREIEEMQYKDISEKLNINLSTIKSQISKGRKIIIKKVEKIFEKLDKEELIDN